MLIKLFLTALLLSAADNYDFYLSLDYFEAPVFHLERSVKIFREKGAITIKSENYSGKDFEKSFDTEDYINLLNSLNKLGIWAIRTDSGKDKINNNYYFLTIKSSSRVNLIRYETHTELAGGNESMPAIIRTIENYVYLYNPEND